MKTITLVAWMLVPLAMLAWHLGPGVDGRARDRAAVEVARAEAALAADDAEEAVEAYSAALAALPAADLATARRLRIERGKARIAASQLAPASQELGALVDELEADPSADPALVDDARAVLATSDFYVAWLKRLEGYGRDDWEPHTESARQTWRRLTEQAESRGDTTAVAAHERDLEAVVRLARMEPDELQGLPIPKECSKCKGGQCRSCNGRKPSRSRAQNNNRSKDARGASSGPPPDDSGS